MRFKALATKHQNESPPLVPPTVPDSIPSPELHIMTDGNVELAFSGMRDAYANSITPPSSPTSKRATAGDIFLDGDEDCEETKGRRKMVEHRLSLVFDKFEADALNNIVPVKALPVMMENLPIHKPHAYPCRSTHDPMPAPPSKWPQAPVMLRPTPRSHTKVRGIRYATTPGEYMDYAGFCAGCILPINTGAEAPGKSLVVDFETKYFVGTLLMRIQEAPPAEAENQTSTSYFDGKKRKFQAIVKGRFKQALPMSHCVTGQIFDRPSGKLPAKWIVSSGIRFLSTLAPQLEASIDGVQPKFLAPLAATAHSVLQTPVQEKDDSDWVCTSGKTPEELDKLVNYTLFAGATDLEEPVEEPPANSDKSILPEVAGYSPPNNAKSSIPSRQKTRKKIFNANANKQNEEPTFRTDREYCFEFYQHLLLFGNDLALDMGMPIGKLSLAQALNGQPLKCMSAVKMADGSIEPLWSFDIWHQSLYPYARAYHDAQKK